MIFFNLIIWYHLQNSIQMDILLWICGEAFNEAVDYSSRSCRCARCDKIELHGRVMRVAPISDEKYGKPTARCGMPGGMMRVSKYSKPSMFFLDLFGGFCGMLWLLSNTACRLYDTQKTWSVERFDTMVIPVWSHSFCGCIGDQWVNSKVHFGRWLDNCISTDSASLIQQGDDWKWCVFFV